MRAYPVRTNDLTKTLIKIARPTVKNPQSLNEAWRFGPQIELRHPRSADSREQVDMAMTYTVLADVAASVTELKKDPMGTIREGGGETVVILNRNEPAFYAVPPARYEAMLELIDDLRLAEIVRARAGEPTVRVDIDDLIAQAGGAD